MNKPQKYYNMQIDKDNKIADVTIFGDITSWPWLESDVSSYKLSKRLEELKGVEQINIHINSYGGEVAEGWAIYNALINHPANVTTIVDGFACSIASVIFMAGKERIMNETSVLMIHNVLSYVCGNANDMRKQADDLEKLNNLSKKAYLKYINIEDEKLQKMMNEETFIVPDECIKMGFATEIKNETQKKYSQSARKVVLQKLLNKSISNSNEDGGDDMVKYECQECGYIHDGELPEYFICPECGANKDAFIETENTGDDIENDVDEQEEQEVQEPTEENEDEKQNDDINQKNYRFFNALAHEGRND